MAAPMRELLGALTGSGLSTGESARVISGARRAVRCQTETLPLAVARSLEDTANTLEAVALDYRHAAAAVRGVK